MRTFTPGAVRRRRHAKLIKAAGQQLDAAAPAGFRELRKLGHDATALHGAEAPVPDGSQGEVAPTDWRR